MGLILRSEGIQRCNSEGVYIAADFSTIPRDDFELICHTLAEGIPLVATYWAGKRRSYVGYCKRYKSPPEHRYGEKGAVHIGHAVVLIGAGMKKGKRFFYFLNSWGKKFCPRKNKRGETIAGGIGKIAEGDLTKNVVRLSHPNESGGERRLENQSGMAISRCNYLLMKAMVGQCSAEGIRKVREAEKSGKIQSVWMMMASSVTTKGVIYKPLVPSTRGLLELSDLSTVGLLQSKCQQTRAAQPTEGH